MDCLALCPKDSPNATKELSKMESCGRKHHAQPTLESKQQTGSPFSHVQPEEGYKFNRHSPLRRSLGILQVSRFRLNFLDSESIAARRVPEKREESGDEKKAFC
jgi:hypothetical protein